MVELGQKEMLVIAYLRKHARMRLTQLSRLTHIPVSTLYDQVAHRYHNVISKYTVLIDFAKLHYATRVTVMLKVQKEEKKELEHYLFHHPHVNSLYKINNGYDFMVDVIFPTLFQFEQFLDRLESQFPILETQCYHVIEDLKREEFLAQPLPKSSNGNSPNGNTGKQHAWVRKDRIMPRMVSHLSEVRDTKNTTSDAPSASHHASPGSSAGSPSPTQDPSKDSSPAESKPAKQNGNQQNGKG